MSHTDGDNEILQHQARASDGKITGWDSSDQMFFNVRKLALDAAMKVSPQNSRVSNIIANASEFEDYIMFGAPQTATAQTQAARKRA